MTHQTDEEVDRQCCLNESDLEEYTASKNTMEKKMRINQSQVARPGSRIGQHQLARDQLSQQAQKPSRVDKYATRAEQAQVIQDSLETDGEADQIHYA